MALVEHLDRYGPLPDAHGDELIRLVASSGLRGRGGADFPVATKMDAVAAGRRRAVVVANGAEGEPASGKDKLLMRALPHLVLDGAALAARAVGAREALVCVAESARDARGGIGAAIDERARAGVDRTSSRLVTVPDRYLAGEESALTHWLNAGRALPTLVPPRPFERGVHGRPTLVQNVETLAHLAQIARYGDGWFRELGTRRDPGSGLVTVSGAVARPGVYEIACGTRLDDLVAAAGAADRLQAFLIGGYFGSWHAAPEALQLSLGHSWLRESGDSLGAGVIIALPQRACGLRESARVMRYMADESSGQCGPCVYGLDSIARELADLADGVARPGTGRQLLRWADDVAGRGACHHPDGAIRFLRSTLSVFAEDALRHEREGPCGIPSRGILGVPLSEPATSWR